MSCGENEAAIESVNHRQQRRLLAGPFIRLFI